MAGEGHALKHATKVADKIAGKVKAGTTTVLIRRWVITELRPLDAKAAEAYVARTICGQVRHTFKSWFAMGLTSAIMTEIAYILVDVALALVFYVNYVCGVVY